MENQKKEEERGGRKTARNHHIARKGKKNGRQKLKATKKRNGKFLLTMAKEREEGAAMSNTYKSLRQ